MSTPGRSPGARSRWSGGTRGLSPLARAHGPGAEHSDGRRRHLPHLLHDQAHRLSGPDAAVRARQVPAARRGPSLHPRMENPDGRPGPGGRIRHPREAGTPDEHARRPHAHDRPAGRDLPGQPDRHRVRRGSQCTLRGADARERDGTPGGAPAQVPPRDALELRHLHRHRGQTRRDPLRAPLRRLPPARALRAAGHGRHRVLRARGVAAPLGRLLPVPPGQHPGPHGGPLRRTRSCAPVPTSREPAAWSRPPTTTSPSARCWPTAASSAGGGCSGARPWSS